MMQTPCCGRISPPLSAQPLSSRQALGNSAHFHRRPLQRQGRRGSLQVQNAINREKKEKIVGRLKEGLDSSIAVFGVRYNKLTVKQFDGFRNSMPEGAQVIAAKNTLMGVAIEQTAKPEKWAGLKDGFLMENAWVFANENNIKEVVKAYKEFEEELREKYLKEERKKMFPTNVSIGVLDGTTLDREGVLGLEKMMTKQQAIGMIAGMLIGIPTKLAMVTKMVPTKLALAVNALTEGDDKTKTVGEVFPKAKTES